MTTAPPSTDVLLVCSLEVYERLKVIDAGDGKLPPRADLEDVSDEQLTAAGKIRLITQSKESYRRIDMVKRIRELGVPDDRVADKNIESIEITTKRRADISVAKQQAEDDKFERQERSRRRARRKVDAEELAEAAKAAREDWDDLYLNEDELAALTTPPGLIGDVLPAASNGILRGRDGTYKSFCAIDWALHIAAGKPWCGHAVDQGAVLVVAGEGAHGAKHRVAAWREYHEITDPLPFVLRKTALNMHTPGPAFEHLLEWVEGHKIKFVVIDTLRRVSGGADGNGSEMGSVVDNVDRIKQAMAEVSGSTLLIAHTDKTDKDTRGFSGLEDDADYVWHARREENSPLLVLRHAKNKDGPELLPISLVAETTGPSLVLTAAAGSSAPSAEGRITDFLVWGTDEVEEGETAAVIKSKTGLPERTLYEALGRMLASGDLVLTREKRPKKYAARASSARYL